MSESDVITPVAHINLCQVGGRPCIPYLNSPSLLWKIENDFYTEDWEVRIETPNPLTSADKYKGIADLGCSPDQESWSVMRIRHDENGQPCRKQILHNVRWTDRHSLVYPGDATKATAVFVVLNNDDPALPRIVMFQNDCYPEDWHRETAELSAQAIAGWCNAYFSGSAVAVAIGNVVTLTAVLPGAVGNSLDPIGSDNPACVSASGAFIGGQDEVL